MIKKTFLLILAFTLLFSTTPAVACFINCPTPPPPQPHNYAPIIIAPASPNGGVQGTIQIKTGTQYVPLINVDLMLANVLWCPSYTCAIASLDPRTAPRTTTDSSGHFAFANIKPNDYVIILYEVTTAYLVNKPPDGKMNLVFTINAGETTELGLLQYNCALEYCGSSTFRQNKEYLQWTLQ